MNKTLSINNLKWQEILRLCLEKYDFEKADYAYSHKSFMRRMLLAIGGKKPKDPAPGWKSSDLGTCYVQAYNDEKGFGRRLDMPDGTSLHSVLRFQSEDRLPILTVTYYECGTAYVERRKFRRNGGVDELEVPYPTSEFGLWGLPRRPEKPELVAIQKCIPELIKELRSATMG